MNIESVILACFSPTGTTKAIVQAIARGIDLSAAELVDVTNPEARSQPLQTSDNELLIIGIPVYNGRVPALLSEWLHAIRANKTPSVCVVVYGNRAYDDALLELKDIVKERGGMPIACAAFIGEHSFSISDAPIAAGRPDSTDLHHAELFGRKIKERLQSISSVDDVSDIRVPGAYPYRDLLPLFSVDFIEISDACSNCGVCAEACPVGAIDLENGFSHDKEKCVLCCACIKSCLENAATMKPGIIKDIAIRVSQKWTERKEPECFY